MPARARNVDGARGDSRKTREGCSWTIGTLEHQDVTSGDGPDRACRVVHARAPEGRGEVRFPQISAPSKASSRRRIPERGESRTCEFATYVRLPRSPTPAIRLIAAAHGRDAYVPFPASGSTPAGRRSGSRAGPRTVALYSLSGPVGYCVSARIPRTRVSSAPPRDSPPY